MTPLTMPNTPSQHNYKTPSYHQPFPHPAKSSREDKSFPLPIKHILLVCMAVRRMTQALVRILRRKMEKMMKLAKMLVGNSEKKPVTPIGCLAVYVGEEAKRLVVPVRFLSHPLFKMLLEKAHEEYGFEQRRGLVIPCSVCIFQEVVRVVDCCHGQFDFEKSLLEFL